jgi:dipeptidyl aminopeptidase/acylaminoacyl peptidase
MTDPSTKGISARSFVAALGVILFVLGSSSSAPSQTAQSPDFDRMARQQAITDRAWRAAAEGYMAIEKIAYRSRAGNLVVPAFVFQPLEPSLPASRPALVWVHEDVRGHLYEHYIPYIRDAVAQGYVVVAPEYRGSVGYGRPFYDAIDYGGAEVDDVVSAVDVLKARYPLVDPERIGIIGWSHGGLITLLSIFRNPTTFRVAAAIVPVTNLIQRLARKGVDRQRQIIDPQNRFGGLPGEKPEVYKERSPLFNVDKLEIPLYVAVATNDDDVNIEESMPLIDALRARKPWLTETMVYNDPPGGHLFDRRVLPRSWLPENTPEQVDSWGRVWRFLGAALTLDETPRFN